MPLTSADCKKIGKLINHATGRCITKKTEKRLRHKQGDFSECASGKTRNTKNRCVAVKTKINSLKKQVAKAKNAQKKADAKVKDNVKKGGMWPFDMKVMNNDELMKAVNNNQSGVVLADGAKHGIRSMAKGIANKTGFRGKSANPEETYKM